MKTLWLTLGLMLVSQHALSFVLLSGPSEAKLSVNEDSPIVDMYWNGESLPLDELADYDGGRLEGLSESAATQALIQDAISIWNEVPGSFIEINLVVDASAEVDSEDGRHVISVKELENLSTAAFAAPEIEEDVIIDCDVTIAKKETTAKTLAYTIAHELGHCLGLGHPHTNYGAMMGYSRDHHDLNLGADDIAGLIYLYPAAKYGDGSVTNLGCAVLGGRKHLNNWWVMLMFLGFIPVAVCRDQSST